MRGGAAIHAPRALNAGLFYRRPTSLADFDVAEPVAAKRRPDGLAASARRRPESLDAGAFYPRGIAVYYFLCLSSQYLYYA